MLYRLSVEEMFHLFGCTFQTIEIRTAAIRERDKWINVYTVVRLTYEEPSVALERLRRLEDSHVGVQTESFEISMSCRPFAEWKDFHAALAFGRVDCGNKTVVLPEPLADRLIQERAYLQTDYSGLRPFDGRSWPVAQYCLMPHSSSPLMGDEIGRQVARLGHSDPQEAVNLLCELNLRAGSSNGFQFCLSVPSFALISKLSLRPVMRQISVEMLRHRELRSLTGMVVLKGHNWGTGAPAKYRIPIARFNDESVAEHFATATGSVGLPESRDDDWLEAQLLHPELGDFHHRSDTVRSLVPPADRNILFEALIRFCSESELIQLTTRPFDQRTPKTKASAAFEQRVAWVLGLLGFATVILGDHEYLVAPETNIRRGSVDILAASQEDRQLLLVACTLAAAKDEDFRNLIACAEILRTEVYTDARVRINTLLCSAAPGQGSAHEAGGISIPVLDSERLGIALRLIGTGRESSVRAFLTSPLSNEMEFAP